MADWYLIALNLLWILGVAAIVAAAGYYYWHASGNLRRLCAASGFQTAASLGAGLCSLGIAVTSGSWWPRGLWGLMALLTFGQAWLAARSPSKTE